MVLGTSLYKDLSWSFMRLIRSELYCLGIRIHKKKKKKIIAIIGRERTVYGLITQTLQKLPEQNFHALSFISKRSVVVVLISLL